MKRNMELIKEIMIFIEVNASGNKFAIVPSERLTENDPVVILEHCLLIIERGLAKGKIIDSGECYFESLTWEGHDFIDNARNSTVWNAAIKSAGKLSFGVFQEVLKASAIAVAMNTLKGAFQ